MIDKREPEREDARLYAAERVADGPAHAAGERPPVVFLHGFGGCHAVWDGVADRLAGEARTIAYDLPGHGRSMRSPGAGSARRAAAAILADITARGLSRVHLVGHSMGGAVATLVAAAEPQRVASLTLIAPGGFGEEINEPLLRRYAAAVDDAEIGRCLAAMSGPDAHLADAALAPYREMRRRPGQTAMLLDILGMIAPDGRQGVIPREMLASLAMPVAVAWGDRDPVLPFGQTGNLPPQFRLHRLPGAGHMLVCEAQEAVANLVLAGMRAA